MFYRKRIMTDRIITPRLTLRRYARRDAARVAVLIGEWDVARWLLHVPYPYAEADAHTFIERSQQAGPHIYAITLKDTVIGGISIKDELGYWLGKAFWGKGFATEAARALIQRYFAGRSDDLRSGYIIGNWASCNVLTKLGFAKTHVKELHCAALNKPVRVQKMILSSDALQACQGAV